MELIEKIKQALCDNSPFDDDKPDDYEGEAQAVLTALIEHASGDGVTEALRAENARLTKQRDFLGERLADLALEMGRLRAALEQGEAAILRAERNEP